VAQEWRKARHSPPSRARIPEHPLCAAAPPPALRLRLEQQRTLVSPNSQDLTPRALPQHRDFAHGSRMNNIATIENQPKHARERKITKRVRHAIDLMIRGQCRTQKAAAEKVGLSPERLCRALKESHVQEYLGRQTRVLLAQSQSTAAATLMTLMDQAKSEHVRKDIAVTLLGYNGIRADAERGPLVSIAFGAAGPGYAIDLRLDQSKAGVASMGDGGGVILDEPATEMRDVTPRRDGAE
jgi:hypothetical protein